jgi:hypothetical protein
MHCRWSKLEQTEICQFAAFGCDVKVCYQCSLQCRSLSSRQTSGSLALGKSAAESPVSLNMVHADEALEIPLCMAGTTI